MIPVFAYFGASFFLHLAWENAQMPLYGSSGESSWHSFVMCLYATATGDMLFTLALYLTVAVVNRDLRWARDRTAYKHPATWVLQILVGILLATGFELWAVHAVGRWQYADMPIVPVIEIGLTPLLQMIFIPAVATLLCRQMAMSTVTGESSITSGN